MTLVTGLARERVWWRWSAAVGFIRMPPAMAGLALVFLGERAAGSYAVGAALAGCYALGGAVSAPWRGRALDRRAADDRVAGIKLALVMSVLALLALAGAAWVRMPAVVLFALTAVAAVLPAGVPGGYRAMLTGLLHPALLGKAFSWDAVVVEVEWLIAPLILTAVLLSGQPPLAVVVMAAFVVAGIACTKGLPSSGEPVTGAPDTEPVTDAPDAGPATGSAAAGPGGAWAFRPAWPTYVTSLLLGFGEGGMIAVLPALVLAAHGATAMTGVLAATLSAGSLLGGVSYAVLAHRINGNPAVHGDIALLLMGLLLLPAALVSQAYWLLLPVFAGGMFIAPVNALRSQALQRVLPMRLRSEGYSIQSGAYGLGAAAGSLLVAVLVPAGPRIAFAAVIAIPTVAIAASLVRVVFTRR